MAIRLKRNSDRITYDDSSSNTAGGSSTAILQSAISQIDSRLDAVETTTAKTLLNTPTTFYIDGVNGVDGTNTGLTIGTAFRNLIYALISIRDRYIIDTQVTIELLTDITVEGYYSLRGFELGLTELYPFISITSNNSDRVNLANNKTIKIGENGFGLSSFSQELYFDLGLVNFAPLNPALSSVINLTDSQKLTFYANIFTKTQLRISSCKDVQILGITSSAYTKFIDSSLDFNNCNTCGFDTIDLVNSSSISFSACYSVISNQSRRLRISGVSSSNSPYLSYRDCINFGYLNGISRDCINFGYLNGISINTSTLTNALLIIDSCSNFEFNITLGNTVGGTVTYQRSSTSTNNNSYIVQVYRSDDIVLTGGSNTKFINPGSNGAWGF